MRQLTPKQVVLSLLMGLAVWTPACADDQLQGQIDRIAKEVGAVVGIELKAPNPAERISGDDYRNILRDQLETLSPKNRIKGTLRSCPDQKSDLEQLLDLPATATGATYNPDSKSIQLTPGSEISVSDETAFNKLVHAAQDQRHDLKRIYKQLGAQTEEHHVEFQNQDVKLAGSLLLPKGKAPVPAVVFVHGAGQQTRESYRELGEYFAGQGIAALIYDKRGCGLSGGTYESYEPYENLVNDALSAVAFLKQRHEIEKSQIGMWGLSQGAYISAAAASRSEDIQFVIGVGASVADCTDFYYRDNLFRKYGLSDKLRDLAEKAQLLQDTLPHNLRDESLLSSFLPRSYPPPDKYVHPAWSRVQQPVLVMWGQLDQHQPVGESILGLKNSLAHANNEKWTMIILPRAKHSLGISDTGAIQEKWRGYPPGALKTMTDWAWHAIDHPSEIDKMNQVGDAEAKGILSKAVRYEELRWYGNGTIQAALWILFLISFLANTIAGVRYGLSRLFHRQPSAALQASDKVLNFKRALCSLNLLILVALGITTLLVLDQIHPSCPAVLMYLPLLGSVSTLATIAVLIALARTPRDNAWTAARRIRFSLDVLCLLLFVPYMFYWNLIGLRF